MQYSELNVNKKFDFIVRSMKSLADTHMPVRKYTRREYKPKQKPWITQGIISSIKHRDYLFCVYKRSKLLTDFETYKLFRNRLTHVKDLAKRKYYEEQFARNSRNSKRTWKLMLWLKITPTYCNMKDNDIWREKYSSDTARRTEENNCLGCLSNSNERCRKPCA